MAVQHVGQHRNGMPVAGDLAMPGPFEAFDCQARLDARVGGDEISVVEIDEFALGYGPVNEKRARGQEERNPKRRPGPWSRGGWAGRGHRFIELANPDDGNKSRRRVPAETSRR